MLAVGRRRQIWGNLAADTRQSMMHLRSADRVIRQQRRKTLGWNSRYWHSTKIANLQPAAIEQQLRGRVKSNCPFVSCKRLSVLRINDADLAQATSPVVQKMESWVQ
jgi:hypothetical protein